MLTPGQIKMGLWELCSSFGFPGNTQAPFSHEYSDYCFQPPYTHPDPSSFGTSVILLPVPLLFGVGSLATLQSLLSGLVQRLRRSF